MEEPKLVRRHDHRRSTIKSGRTIGEKRERLETANERSAARKKDKRKSLSRVVFTVVGFGILAGVLVALFFTFSSNEEAGLLNDTIEIPYSPTIEIIDEDTAATGGNITARMKEYIGQAEADFRALGYAPERAVIPTGTIREVDFYLKDYSGFIKMLIDRGSAVSVEDADRMIRYLASQGVNEFSYIDVRLAGKAYWK